MKHNKGLQLTSITALGLLLLVLAAGPATRPSAGQYLLRVCRYDGKAAVVTSEFCVDLDRPFANKTRVGSDTVTISGTVRPTGRRHDVDLRVTYEEVDSDPKVPGYWKVSTHLEPDLGREQDLAGRADDFRIAVTVTPPSHP